MSESPEKNVQFRGCVFRPRYLDLSQEGPAQLMVDLVRGTAAWLRHLRLPDEHVFGRARMRSGRPSRCLSPGLLASVSRCVELRSLAANLMHVACVSDMPHLRSLELWLSEQEVGGKSTVDPVSRRDGAVR